MNKLLLFDVIVGEITVALNNSLAAAEEARATATNKENAAENKYDTLGLEAAYLAHGQSERVVQLEKDLAAYVLLKERIKDHATAEVGSLLRLEPETGEDRILFIGPASGGLVVSLGGVSVTVITPSSPLGKALLGRSVDDDVSINVAGSSAQTRIVELW
jgi:transcription elongation GreA/GreB family factor|tara:strand:- start:2383 stop:2862 length:480 start_codon:yes stop_codon:yes gene_type:complete